MEVMPRLPMNGSTNTTLPTRLAPLIKHLAMTMELDAHPKSNAKIAYLVRDAGPNRKLKFTPSISSDK